MSLEPLGARDPPSDVGGADPSECAAPVETTAYVPRDVLPSEPGASVRI